MSGERVRSGRGSQSAGSIAEVLASPAGPQVAAYFDLDGTKK